MKLRYLINIFLTLTIVTTLSGCLDDLNIDSSTSDTSNSTEVQEDKTSKITESQSKNKEYNNSTVVYKDQELKINYPRPNSDKLLQLGSKCDEVG